MRLTPSPLVIADDAGFANTDIFEYARFGVGLADLVANIEEPLVMTLDGPWGSGKSTFVQQWAGLLRQRGTPVIVFDAFANDYQEDAFLALAAAITEASSALLGKKGAKLSKFKKAATAAGRVLLPIAGKIAVRLATAGLLSADDVKSAGTDLGEATKSASDSLGASVERVIEDKLNRAKQDSDTLVAFRSALEEVVAALAAGRQKIMTDSADATKESQPDVKQFKLIFVIDELDRCRPTFALDLLERVKHLYSVSGVVFLFVTNMAQLEAAVRGAYGHDTDARAYLEKFINLRLVLPEPSVSYNSKRRRYIDHLWSALDLKTKDRDLDDTVKKGILIWADAYGLSLRTIERIASHHALVKAYTNENYLRLGAYVAGLCVMRQLRPDLYDRARTRTLSWPEARDFLKLSDPWSDEDSSQAYFTEFWRFATEDPLPDEHWVKEVKRFFSRWHIRDTRQLLPWTCSYIDSFILGGS